ncbi:MAG: response regulator [Acidobacteriota bacterium]
MDESRPAGARQSAPGTPHPIEEARRALRILLAEDNAVNREVTTAMLSKRGHQVDIAVNGKEAVEAVRRSDYDVVLMDLQMPELDGHGATREIRRLLNGRALPIIAVTANVLAGERARCLASGMDDYLAKPFRAPQLYAMVEGWVPGPAALPDQTAVLVPVDLEEFLTVLREGGIEEAMDDIISEFIKDAPLRLAAIEEAAAKKDCKAIERAAHAFKSAAGTIRATGLAAVLRETEAAGKSGDLTGAIALLQQVRFEYAAAMAYLDARIVGGHANA